MRIAVRRLKTQRQFGALHRLGGTPLLQEELGEIGGNGGSRWIERHRAAVRGNGALDILALDGVRLQKLLVGLRRSVWRRRCCRLGRRRRSTNLSCGKGRRRRADEGDEDCKLHD
jgi:hypothetical protein